MPGSTDEQVEVLRAASRDVRRAHRIRTGQATTVRIDVADLRRVLHASDENMWSVLADVLGPHTTRAVHRRTDAELSA